MCRTTTILSLMLLIRVLAAAELPAFRGDHGGVFADCTPPTTWSEGTVRWHDFYLDDQSRKHDRWKDKTDNRFMPEFVDDQDTNIVYRAQLPVWGNSGIIAIGGHLYMMMEMDPMLDAKDARDFEPGPSLICVDPADGSLRWRRAVHPPMRPGESARIKSEFHWYVTTQFARWRLCRELEELNGIAWKGQVRDAAGLAKHPAETRRLLTAIRELGCVGLTDGDIDRLLQGDEKVMKIRKGRYSPQIAYTGEGEARIAWLRERGFYLTGYGPYGNSGIGGYDECPQYWAGEAAATPATDGRYVFALTTARTLAAFSLDGKAAWSVQLPADHPKRLFDILCSPLYHDGIVIVVTSAGTFGVDATNGQLRYTNTDSAQGGYADPPPVFLTVDGDRYVAHANGCIMHATSGRTALARVWATQSHSTWTSHGDTVYLVVSGQDGAWKGRADTLFAKEAGAAVQAIRFTRAGDGLEAERLWRLRGEKRGSLVYHDGLVFGVINVGQDRKGTTVLAAIDAETGEVLAQHPVLEGIDSQGKARGGVALGAWHLDVAGGHLFTSDGGFRSRGMVSVLRADRSLAIVSRCNLLRGHGYDPQRFARYPRWGRFTEMFPTLFSGNRIFIRCFDALYCLGSGPLRLSAHHR